MDISAALLWTDAPLWAWLAIAAATASLSLAGLLISRWFHRRRRQR